MAGENSAKALDLKLERRYGIKNSIRASIEE